MGNKIKALVSFSSITDLVVVFSMFFLFQNCSSNHKELPGAEQTKLNSSTLQYEQNALGIIGAKCSSCHNSTTASAPKQILDKDYLTAQNYIKIGAPQESKLYIYIIDYSLTNAINPHGGQTVTDSEVGIIRDWIAVLGGNYDTVIGGPTTQGSDTPAGPTGTFTQVKDILLTRCLTCHGVNLPNLAAATRDQLVASQTRAGLMAVVPGDVGRSRIYQAVAGNNMPMNQAPLTQIQKDLIRSWIAAGAPND